MAWLEPRWKPHGTAKYLNKKTGKKEPCFLYVVGRWPDGERISKSTPSDTGPLFKEARNWVEERESGRVKKAEEITGFTLVDAVRMYRGDMKSRGFKPGSIRDYGYAFDMLLDYCEKGWRDPDHKNTTLMSEITKKKIKEFRSHLISEYKINGVFSKLGYIKAFFSYFVDDVEDEEKKLEFNPASKIMKGYKRENVQTRITYQQAIFILNCISRVRKVPKHVNAWLEFKDIVLTAIFTGFRRGDLEKFKKNWIVDNLIYVEEGKGRGKKGKPRIVPMSEELAKTLAPYLARTGEFVFDGWDGHKIYDHWVTLYSHARKLDKTLPERCRVHDLRHSFAKHALQAGVPMERLQIIMGHSSIQTTIDTYGDLDATDLISAMKKMSVGFEQTRLAVVG